MGVAITAGLAGSAATTLAVFLAMGAGLAAPYVLLAGIPAVIKLLPRPGRWMDVLKQALAFPMYGACVWLVWVLSQQAGPDGVLAAGAGLFLVGLAAWALGLAQRGSGRMASRGVAILAGLTAAFVLAGLAVMPPAAAVVANEAGVEPFSVGRLAELRAQGRPVLVNMTAAWCVTCLVNERVALSSPRIREAMAARGITYMKGDWTRQDPDISAFLRQLDRDGVPLYALFPGGDAAPELLPQLLSETTVMTALERLARK
jgi:thiol:disulfide interchange protein DsbD